jgi:hypothetical protein
MTAATAQVPFQRLAPDTLVANAVFGQQVALAGDQLFVSVRTVDRWDRCCTGAVNVYANDGVTWERTQRIVHPIATAPSGISEFRVAGDYLIARGEGIHAFRNDGGTWLEHGSLAGPEEQYDRIIAMSPDYLLLQRNDGDRNSNNQFTFHMFERRDNEWVNSGSVPRRSSMACIVGDEILMINNVADPAPLSDLATPTAPAEVAAVLIARQTDAGWDIVETIPLGGKPVTHYRIDCDDETAAVMIRGTVLFLNRESDDTWTLAGSMDVSDRVSGAMSIGIGGDYFYLSQEIRVTVPESPLGIAVRSNLAVYSRRFGPWEFLRSFEPFVPFDPTWEYNDGCLGYDIDANAEYVVAGAPVRGVLIGDDTIRDVGETYVLATRLIDHRPERPIEEPTYDLGWSAVYPSPGRGATTFAYSLPVEAHVDAEAFDVLGRRVTTVAEGRRANGAHEASFDTSGWAPGVYFLRMSVNDRGPAVRTFVVD